MKEKTNQKWKNEKKEDGSKFFCGSNQRNAITPEGNVASEEVQYIPKP